MLVLGSVLCDASHCMRACRVIAARSYVSNISATH
jgi:hypothetical protein